MGCEKVENEGGEVMILCSFKWCHQVLDTPSSSQSFCVQEKYYSITPVYCAYVLSVFLKLHKNLVIIASAFLSQDPVTNLLPSTTNEIFSHPLHALLSQAFCKTHQPPQLGERQQPISRLVLSKQPMQVPRVSRRHSKHNSYLWGLLCSPSSAAVLIWVTILFIF